MSIKPDLASGSAPIWETVPDGLGWASGAKEGLGFYLDTTGAVAFKTTDSGSFIVKTFPANFTFPAYIKAIGATADGTTATGLLVATTG